MLSLLGTLSLRLDLLGPCRCGRTVWEPEGRLRGGCAGFATHTDDTRLRSLRHIHGYRAVIHRLRPPRRTPDSASLLRTLPGGDRGRRAQTVTASSLGSLAYD